MLEVAMITALAAHLSTPDEIEITFDLPRSNAAEVLQLQGYGIVEGMPTGFVLLEAADVREALRFSPRADSWCATVRSWRDSGLSGWSIGSATIKQDEPGQLNFS